MIMIISIVYIGFALLALWFFYRATDSDKKVLIVSLIWLAVVGTLASTHFFENLVASPPRFALVLVGNICMVIYFLKSLKVSQIKPRFLLLVHSLRLPVELGFHYLYLQHLIPEIMTYQGWNFDIIAGLSALILFLYQHYNQSWLSQRFWLIWNIYGLISLLIIVVIAILSAPLPFQQLAFEQPNIAVLRFPFIFIPSFIVPIVLVSHLLVLKRSWLPN